MDRLLCCLLGGCLLIVLVVMAAGAADYSMVGNIHYDQYPDTVLDILQPPHPALQDRPAVVMIHGGGWVGGSKSEMMDFSKPFLERDYVVANVEYRLAAAAPAPAAVIDVLKASRWLVDHAAEYRVDPKRITVAGFSAGGHLALMAGMLNKDTDFGPVTKFAGIIDFYGVADVVDAFEAKRDYAVQWLGTAPDAMDLAKKVSPMSYVRKDAPPVLIIHGDQDDVVPYQQSVKLQAALKKVGAKVDLITVPGGKHGFTPTEDAAVMPQIFKWMVRKKK
jgi:acetyl esterase/lipase